MGRSIEWASSGPSGVFPMCAETVNAYQITDRGLASEVKGPGEAKDVGQQDLTEEQLLLAGGPGTRRTWLHCASNQQTCFQQNQCPAEK